jgi:putative DNA primase/helicase
MTKHDPAAVRRTGKTIVREAIDHAQPLPNGKVTTDDPNKAATFPHGFEMRPDGLYRSGRSEKEKPLWIAGHFEVVAESRPKGNDAWGLLLRWQDRDGVTHMWNMPRAMVAGDAAELRAHLAACGLEVSNASGARTALVDFLMRVKTRNRVRTVPRVGWHFSTNAPPAFVLPGQVCAVPGAAESLLLDMDTPPTIYGSRGTTAEWKNQVTAQCLGNDRLLFAVSLAFAGPLLALVGEEGGGFHLRGDSSLGKTTALHVAASVWGAPTGPDAYVRQWRATGNALEGAAAAHNDGLMPLDEIGQADLRDLGEIAYMVTSGQGKARMQDRGGLRPTATWRVLFLSTGEESLADAMSRANRTVKAGQEVRFLDLPADAGAGHGLFQALHGKLDGDDFSRVLRAAIQDQHGTAGPAFLHWLVHRMADDPTYAPETLKPRLRTLTQSLTPAGADGQVHRAAGRFALVALAGELATEASVTGWPPGAAEAATAACFNAWLIMRGSTGSREAQHLIAAVRRYLVQHGAVRFETIEKAKDDGGQIEPTPPDTRTINRAGWKWQETDDDTGVVRWNYGFVPEVFASDICAPLGMEPNEARRKLEAAKLLQVEDRGGKRRRTIRKSVPGAGRVELVALVPTILDSGDDEPQAA